MSPNTKHASSKAYQIAVADLSRILYAHDPDRMGITVYAPPDEYDDVARLMLKELRDAQSEVEVHEWIRRTYQQSHVELSREARAVIRHYQQAILELR